ncbi:MAG: hypothetical protein M3N43_04120 [Actinomycetota bacterium]|nr:hypothetical protein [Actinomycetota bacterium]
MSTDTEHCTGAAYHAPLPLWTERHHVYPKYLCALVGVAVIPLVRPLCDNCHSRVHHAIAHLINTGVPGHRLSDSEMLLVNLAWSWWQGALLGGQP